MNIQIIEHKGLYYLRYRGLETLWFWQYESYSDQSFYIEEIDGFETVEQAQILAEEKHKYYSKGGIKVIKNI